MGIEDPGTRLRSALDEVYTFFAGGRDMLRQVLRDEDRVPALAEVLVPFHAGPGPSEGAACAPTTAFALP
ncbi:MAG: hypothetical protein RJQ04_09670 [Longimicrobiales bacterium]